MLAKLLGFIVGCLLLPTHEIPLSSWGRKVKNTSPVVDCKCLFFLRGKKIFVCWWWRFVLFHSSGDLKNLPCIIVYVQFSDDK